MWEEVLKSAEEILVPKNKILIVYTKEGFLDEQYEIFSEENDVFITLSQGEFYTLIDAPQNN